MPRVRVFVDHAGQLRRACDVTVTNTDASIYITPSSRERRTTSDVPQSRRAHRVRHSACFRQLEETAQGGGITLGRCVFGLNLGFLALLDRAQAS